MEGTIEFHGGNKRMGNARKYKITRLKTPFNQARIHNIALRFDQRDKRETIRYVKSIIKGSARYGLMEAAWTSHISHVPAVSDYLRKRGFGVWTCTDDNGNNWYRITW